MASTGERVTHGFQLTFGLLGILGNGSVCYTFARSPLLYNKTNLLLLGLAVSNLFSAIFMVFNVYLNTQLTVNVPEGPLGNFYCIFWYSNFLFWTSYQASCYMLISITLERYLVLTNLEAGPQGLHRLTKRETVALLAFPWIIAFILKSFIVYFIRSANGKCVGNWPPSPRVGQAFGIISFLVGYFLPLLFTLLAYARIVQVLKRQEMKFSSSTISSVETQIFRACKKVIRVLVMLTSVFFVLSSPDQVAFFLLTIGEIELEYSGGGGTFFQVSTLLLFLNSVISPIIYIFAYGKFRQAFTKVFLQRITRWWGKSRPNTTTEILTTMTKSTQLQTRTEPGSSTSREDW